MLSETRKHQPLRIVIISGLSGSGKSTAIRALEDIGFFCIDNLPVVLLPKLIELFPRSPGEIERIALVVDARESQFLDLFGEKIDAIRVQGSHVEVVFLDCASNVLIRRYNETRRRHPLAENGQVEDGIRKEREVLCALEKTADQAIDTTEMLPQELRRIIQERFTRAHPGSQMNMTLVSFGYKYGIPAQADVVFDARFLANPYFVPELKGMKGTDEEVSSFVLGRSEAQLFLDHVMSFVKTFRPMYDREGKTYLTVGIGCTGGRHRSVAIVEELSSRLTEDGESLMVRHRDVGRVQG